MNNPELSRSDARIEASTSSRGFKIGLGVAAAGFASIAVGAVEGIINSEPEESFFDSMFQSYFTAGGYLAVYAGGMALSISGIRNLNRYDRENQNEQLKLF